MGKPIKLGMFSEESDPAKVKQLSAFFLNDLSGKETYGVGRYIDIDVNGLPKTLTIDFNRAYNPNCARSPHYNCPFAVEKIALPLRAGEKIPPKHLLLRRSTNRKYLSRFTLLRAIFYADLVDSLWILANWRYCSAQRRRDIRPAAFPQKAEP